MQESPLLPSIHTTPKRTLCRTGSGNASASWRVFRQENGEFLSPPKLGASGAGDSASSENAKSEEAPRSKQNCKIKNKFNKYKTVPQKRPFPQGMVVVHNQQGVSSPGPSPALSVRLPAVPATVGLILGSLHPYVCDACGDMHWKGPTHPPLARARPSIPRLFLVDEEA